VQKRWQTITIQTESQNYKVWLLYSDDSKLDETDSAVLQKATLNLL